MNSYSFETVVSTLRGENGFSLTFGDHKCRNETEMIIGVLMKAPWCCAKLMVTVLFEDLNRFLILLSDLNRRVISDLDFCFAEGRLCIVMKVAPTGTIKVQTTVSPDLIDENYLSCEFSSTLSDIPAFFSGLKPLGAMPLG